MRRGIYKAKLEPLVHVSPVLRYEPTKLLILLGYRYIVKPRLQVKGRKASHAFHPAYTVLQIRCRKPVLRGSGIYRAEISAHPIVLPTLPRAIGTPCH